MAQSPSPDAVLLDQLARSGSDLKQLHRFEFLLHFPSKFSAERAEGELIGLAFETRVEQGKSTDQWAVHGWKVMYPVESDLAGLRDKLDAIAAEGRGTYDGWTAKLFVRKPAG
jgi:hypothetical protein